jgi:hypothetical protein
VSARALQACVAGALVCALSPAPARAQDTPEADEAARERAEDALFELETDEDSDTSGGPEVAGDDRGEGERLDTMTRAGFESVGFDFGDRARSQRQSTATLLALSAGLFAHGIGHWYLGDLKTAWILAVGEGAGVALAVTGLVLPALAGPDSGVATPARHLVYVGTSLFGATYAMDVAGTLSGAVLPNTNQDALTGASVRARYGYLQPARYPLNNALEVDAQVDLGPLGFGGGTLQDFNLRHSTYDARARWIPLRAARTPRTWAGVEANGELLQFREGGRFDRWAAGASAVGELDMAAFSATLRRVVVGARFGWERQFVMLPEAQSDFTVGAEPSPLSLSYTTDTFPFALWLQTDVAPRLNARLALSRRDGEVLQDLPRFLVVPSAELSYRSADNVDLEFKVEYGSGPGIWGGLRVWLWR